MKKRRKGTGLRDKLKSFTTGFGGGSRDRPDKIVSSSSVHSRDRSHTAPQPDAYNAFGQGIGEDESWMYQRKR